MTGQRDQPDPGRRRLVACAVAFGLVLYGLTCAPGVVWQDSAMFQFRVWHGNLSGQLGLPLAHPLYILLARAFTVLPLGDFAFRVNLFSALCGAACLGLAMDLLLCLTRSRFAAIAGTILLAVSHTFWTHAVIAELYDLYALGLLAELRVLERFFTRRQCRWLILALFLNGLNVSNHLLALLHGPAYVGVVIWALFARRIRVRQLPLLAMAFLAGTLPYLLLIISEIAGGQPVLLALKEALVGPPHRAHKVLTHAFPVVRQSVRSVEYFALNFPTPLVLLAPLGVWFAWKQPRTRWFIAVGATIFVIAFVFAFRYLVPDQYVFFTPCYVLLALFVALAIPRFVSQTRPRRIACLGLAILPAGVYELAPPMMKHWDVSIGVKREIPFRDSLTYFLRPRKNGEHSASRFATAALRQAAPDSLLIADSTIKNALVYVRDVEGVSRNVALNHGPDTTPAPPAVALTPEAVRLFAELKAAYICDDTPEYVPAWILRQYDAVPDGILFRLKEKPMKSSP